MDKDKLIKEAERMWHEYCGHLDDDNFHWSFYWLIRQVKRVQELEKENKRLREALEFYANQKSWMNREVTILMDGEPTDVEDCPAIFDDGGNIARKALE